MVAQKDRHISLTSISDILWDNLCIERSEKRCYSIPIKGIKYLSLREDFLGPFKNISLKIRHNEEILKI
jgi:hypothetical protein